MRTPVNDTIYTFQEYLRYESLSERPCEFVDGKIYEREEQKDIWNEIGGKILFQFYKYLKNTDYRYYCNVIKIAIPGGNRYYCPDGFATKGEKNEDNQYIKYEPEIIVEVVSESSQVTDYVDKYIDYTKIPSLHYYLIIEPETILVTVYQKDENNNWVANKYTRTEDIVKLEKLGFEFAVKDVYK